MSPIRTSSRMKIDNLLNPIPSVSSSYFVIEPEYDTTPPREYSNASTPSYSYESYTNDSTITIQTVSGPNIQSAKKPRLPKGHPGPICLGNSHFECVVCEKVYQTKQGWANHQWTHIGDGQIPRPFVCEFCGETFSQTGNMKTHRYTHTGERPYLCRRHPCTKAFAQASNRNKHEHTPHHAPQELTQNWRISPASSTSSSSLYGHERRA